MFYVAGWFYAIVLTGFGTVDYGPFPTEDACWKHRAHEVRAGREVGPCVQASVEHGRG
jgi:hypothetical protein